MERINNEYYVSPGIAKLLAKVGFNWKVNHHYPNIKSLGGNDKGYIEECSFYEDFNNNGGNSCSCPTLEVAQRWLREVKNIDVYIFPTTNPKRECVYQVGIKTFGRTLWIPGQPSTVQYDTYEIAQESGIKKALEMILKKGE